MINNTRDDVLASSLSPKPKSIKKTVISVGLVAGLLGLITLHVHGERSAGPTARQVFDPFKVIKSFTEKSTPSDMHEESLHEHTDHRYESSLRFLKKDEIENELDNELPSVSNDIIFSPNLPNYVSKSHKEHELITNKSSPSYHSKSLKSTNSLKTTNSLKSTSKSLKEHASTTNKSSPSYDSKSLKSTNSLKSTISLKSTNSLKSTSKSLKEHESTTNKSSPSYDSKSHKSTKSLKSTKSHKSTKAPSMNPSEVPSEVPSEMQTGCQDLPNVVNGFLLANETWTMPYDSVWRNSSFANMTCDELEKIVPENQPDQIETLCKFLSQGIYSGPCALEACCFCGGGDHKFEPRCENMEWNSMKDSGIELNCEFVDALPDVNQDDFCTGFATESFAGDGLTVKEACCACGGGHRHYNHEFVTGKKLHSERKLEGDGASKAGAAAATILPDGTSFVDFIYREGAGDSPGVPNLEYLGLGYDMIRGNPRGSESSEVDPGFRYRVLRLRQVQSDLTVDGAYTVPLGTAIKYTSSCKYDSASREISSETDLRTSLSEEASSESSSNSKSEFSANNLIFSYSQSVSETQSFSQSSKFTAQSQTSQQSSSVSFEARAFCSEFEASFIPGYSHELSPEFQEARDNLPVPYNSNNKRHRGIWGSFFKTFGTDYVSYIILGGKRIRSMSMSQQDFSSLVSQSVDVSSTMSFEMSSAMGASAAVKAGLVKGIASAAQAVGGPKGAAIGSIVNVALNDTDDDETLVGAEYSESSSSSLANFASTKKQAESAFRISQKKKTIQEYTIGGLPSDDWREWAASVKAKPMPMKYELGSLMEFMSYEQSNAFTAASQDYYGIDLSIEPDKPFLNGTMHYGVYTGQGIPLSKNGLDPDEDSRVLIQVDAISSTTPVEEDSGVEVPAKSELVFEDASAKGSWSPSKVVDDGYGACGIKFYYQGRSDCDADDDIGIYQIQFNYCNTRDWNDQTGYINPIATVPPGFVEKYVNDDGNDNATPADKEWECEQDEFICGFTLGWCGVTNNDDYCEGCTFDDDQGIFAMKTSCKKIGELCDNQIGDYCDDGEGDKGEGCGNSAIEEKYKKFINEEDTNDPGTDYVIVGTETKFDQNDSDDNDHVGISALKLVLRETKISAAGGLGPASKIFTYTDVWKGKPQSPTAIFATPIRLDIVPDTRELDQNPFLTTYAGKEFDSSKDNMHFAVTEDLNSFGVVGVMNFGELDLEQIGNSKLQSFSFLNVDDLGCYASQCISCVIAYNGIQVNRAEKNKFIVTKDGDKFIVDFAESYTTPPTVLAQGNWFSLGGEYFPQKINDVAYSIDKISTTGFEIKYGKSSLDRSYLGFNILAFGPDMPTENVNHGIIVACTYAKDDPAHTSSMFGITVVDEGCSDPLQDYFRGVQILFDSQFSDIPTVIVTPYAYNKMWEEGGIPRCVVEDISRTSTRVKCGLIFEDKYEPIPFTVVAVGTTK